VSDDFKPDDKRKKIKLDNEHSHGELNGNHKPLPTHAVAMESDNSDLDDDAMMKLDETLAQAFKLKKKSKKHESELLQYKLRALDFIQELMKSTYRLDLITVRILSLSLIILQYWS
jgi:hypothetical protein